MAYIRRSDARRIKEEWYLAAIRLELVRLQAQLARFFPPSASLKQASPENYLLDFDYGESDEEKSPGQNKIVRGGLTPKDGAAYVEASKAAWGVRLGLL